MPPWLSDLRPVHLRRRQGRRGRRCSDHGGWGSLAGQICAVAVEPGEPKGSLPTAPPTTRSKPNLLSSATRSISGSIGTRKFGPIVLSPSQPFCQSDGPGLACTLEIAAVPGPTQKLRLATYATTNGKGPVLAAGTSTLSVHRGRNDVVAALFGLAAQIAVRPQADVVRQGSWQPVPLVIYGIDAAKAAIPAVSVLNRRGTASVDAVKVTLTGFLNATAGAASDSPLTCCGIAGPVFAYDGLHTGRETFTARAAGYASYSTRLTVLPGSKAPATIVIGKHVCGRSRFQLHRFRRAVLRQRNR